MGFSVAAGGRLDRHLGGGEDDACGRRRCGHPCPADTAIFSSRGAQLMTRLRRTLAFLAAGTLAALSLNVLTASTATAAPFGYNQLTPRQKRLVSGLLATELNGADLGAQSRGRAPSAPR